MPDHVAAQHMRPAKRWETWNMASPPSIMASSTGVVGGDLVRAVAMLDHAASRSL
jgi:hypothetical protein